MEVLHASAPGARVRVLRAAYHSTTGPGAPASSYLLHSSRRVISSGYNFVEPDKIPPKPLEISSNPFESSPEVEIEKETYKVTEPDDIDISEPSKWRCSKNINAMRMPSEESSSTDNTSVIDLTNNKTAIRKSVDRFTPQSDYRETSPIYSLLDAPVTLRTLKYTSLLNGSDNWNNRRKSYSFEETPQLDDSVLGGTDPLTIESSTDSGICKSTEIVNDNFNSESPRYIETKTKMNDIHEETFQDWLSKNRKKPYVNQMKTNKEHITSVQQINEGNVTVKSAGKVSITLPTEMKTEDYHEIKNSRVSDENDRKTKKVEFCKTELHFAAESGTVNIIATDEKPPPSNDFRKKRSVFVPMNDNYNKSITLFGEKSDVFQLNKNESSSFISEVNTIDENTAATKSILKNKMPKPKPYLLGENMVLGDSVDLSGKGEFRNNFTKPTGVSLINSQLEPEQRSSTNSKINVGNEIDWSSFKNLASRTTEIGSINYTRSHQDAYQITPKSPEIQTDINKTIKSKVKILQMSPTPVRAKTRQLRESDLTYFGVAKVGEIQHEKRKHSLDGAYDENNLKEEILHSVKLVKLISNSVGNSEADSDEAPEYENLPMNYNVTPKPAPRLHSQKSKPLNTILEKQDGETSIFQSRRCKLKKAAVMSTSRSLSAPPKTNRQNSMERYYKGHYKPSQSNISPISENKSRTIEKCQKAKRSESKLPEGSISESPLYVNLHVRNAKRNPVEENTYGRRKQLNDQQKNTEKKHLMPNNDSRPIKSIVNSDKTNDDRNVTVKPKHMEKKRSISNRTKILVTPEKSPSKSSEPSNKSLKEDKHVYKESKTVDASTQRHRSSRTESKTDSQGFVTGVKDSHTIRDNKQIVKPISKTDIKTKNIPKKNHKLSGDVCNSESQIRDKQDEHTKITTETVKLSQTKPNKTEKIENTQKKSIRSKYVINYDDQNGTVSSVCKIRSRHGSPRIRNVTNYENKENVRSKTVRKTSSTNKNDMLKFPEQQRQKSKTRRRQSCQML